MPYAYFFRLHPAASFVDDIRSHDSPLTNLMAVVYSAFHVHTVGINVQMENATFGITMQGGYVLRTFEVSLLLGSPFGLAGEVNGIKHTDELI